MALITDIGMMEALIRSTKTNHKGKYGRLNCIIYVCISYIGPIMVGHGKSCEDVSRTSF